VAAQAGQITSEVPPEVAPSSAAAGIPAGSASVTLGSRHAAGVAGRTDISFRGRKL